MKPIPLSEVAADALAAEIPLKEYIAEFYVGFDGNTLFYEREYCRRCDFCGEYIEPGESVSDEYLVEGYFCSDSCFNTAIIESEYDYQDRRELSSPGLTGRI